MAGGGTYHLRVAVEGGQVERRAAVLVSVVGGGAALHQEADDWQVTFETRPAQGAKPLPVRQRQRGSWETEAESTAASCLSVWKP